MEESKKRIAILGGGPSGLFMFKRLIESQMEDVSISIFERKNQLGSGMPYSSEGASLEHITNVSDNEIPEIITHINEWVKVAPKDLLHKFNIAPENFNEYKVLPRLFFGSYMSAQFDLLQAKADDAGLQTKIYLESNVVDIIDQKDKVSVLLKDGDVFEFDHVIICTGHNWPKNYEGKIQGYFDSPYPPAKLAIQLNNAVAIKGSSLTAIDAIRTLSRKNGSFSVGKNGLLAYQLNPRSEGFKIVMHSTKGMLPAVRFHLEDSHLSNDFVLTKEQLQTHRAENGGFISLDFVFDKDFKEVFVTKDPSFYEAIKELRIEEFVELMMSQRENIDPFALLKLEYDEAERSIRKRESVYWKEMLAILSFSMNYPAKYFSAEDTIRLQKTLMPLISIVIAFVPQSSCLELLALYNAGVLDLVSVGSASEVKPHESVGATYIYTDDEGNKHEDYYKVFIDCVGQPHLNFNEFPFKSLVQNKTISPAKLKFKSNIEAEVVAKESDKVEQYENGGFYLKVPGITINDNFNVVNEIGEFNERIFVMAVPYIGGFNPDYSGLDFAEEASKKIINYLKTQ